MKKKYYAFKKNLSILVKQLDNDDKLYNIGITSPKNYFSINFNSVDRVFNEKNYLISKLYEADEIEESKCIEGKNLQEMTSFVADTETIVLNISDKRFSFRANFFLSPTMDIISKSRANIEVIKGLPVWNSVFIRAKRKILSGTVAYLSNSDPGNYYHWMCLTLPLLAFYQQNFELENIDWFYVGKLNSHPKKQLLPFQKETLNRLGIPISKIVHDDCTADRSLVAISSPNLCFGGHHINKTSFNFVRNIYSKELNSQSLKNRIYVTRGNVTRRKVINESQVIDLLSNYGFIPVSMDNLSVDKQVKIFNQAEAIIAPHGAALTNLLFIEERTKVIELIPHGYTNNCFYVLANYGKADYFYLSGKELKEKVRNDIRALDIEIDIDELKAICELAHL